MKIQNSKFKIQKQENHLKVVGFLSVDTMQIKE
ncbi:hypothetical protein SAMD00079811_36300 [Scytonema sp. HK-05]|nr:hypothetical protein SAMD00079811_36300 [Scytonema sp. HK-05]